ncbi:MAG: response regulator [Kangiellaceae bacterium]|nr:response regulator [Kangiellaceae bacterium]
MLQVVENNKILVVDDAKDSRLLLKSLLQDQYEIIEASSAIECLEIIQDENPDLLLLDINMPEVDGYEACTTIRKNESTEFLPIIFVSALDSVEERLKGFEVGADDYLVKPVDGDDLYSRVEQVLKKRNELTQAKNEASEAMHVAMEAMTSSSELGHLIQYVQEVQSLNTISNVIESFISTCENFGLDCATIETQSRKLNASCNSESAAAQILQQFKPGKERIVCMGIRYIFKCRHFIVLVKNMPVEDEAKLGRLKDHIAVLHDIAEGRIESIIANDKFEQGRVEIITQLIQLAEKQIKLTSQKIDNYSLKTTAAMNQMIQNLESMLFSLGLEEDQEQQLMRLADEVSEQLNEGREDTNLLDLELGVILEALYQLLNEKRA